MIPTHYSNTFIDYFNSAMAILSCFPCMINMHYWVLASTVLLLAVSTAYAGQLKTAVFQTPAFEIRPGLAVKKTFFDFEFPKGHIAIQSFKGELIDEKGSPVPLHEAYLHHYFVLKYHERSIGAAIKYSPDGKELPRQIFKRNAGTCQTAYLPQQFGLGAETRKTIYDIPNPFGIEAGNPAEIESGYVEKWLVNILAIDTRGAVDKKGCIECVCSLYNVTKDEFGNAVPPNYKAGFLCCYDNLQCKLQEGFQAPKRFLRLRYTVKYVDWESFMVPLKVYVLDVTDSVKKDNSGTLKHNCKVDYDVLPCKSNGSECIDVKMGNIPMESGGYLIYAVAHQHRGATGAALYGQDGRLLCSSSPIYGKGEEAGNEEGYIVGMSTCYPKPGSIKINNGETLTLVSNYSSTNNGHLAVMGQFYLLVAERLPN